MHLLWPASQQELVKISYCKLHFILNVSLKTKKQNIKEREREEKDFSDLIRIFPSKRPLSTA